MTILRRWTMFTCTAILFGFGLGSVFVYGQLEKQPRGNPMNDFRYTVEHVRRMSDKPFKDVAKAFEAQLGKYDADVNRSAVGSEDAEAGKAKIAALAGPSGFMLFASYDHGALLGLAGQKRKAIQYVVGNPTYALQMTQHDIRASLNAPLRVLIYENEKGKTCVEYDKPTSQFGQFGNNQITPAATMLDRKLEALVAKAIE